MISREQFELLTSLAEAGPIKATKVQAQSVAELLAKGWLLKRDDLLEISPSGLIPGGHFRKILLSREGKK